MRFAPETVATFDATFHDQEGNVVDPQTIYVDLYDARGIQIVDNGAPQRVSVGCYRYEFPIPDDPPLGLWRIEWQAIVNGLNSFGQEVFEVEYGDSDGDVPTPSAIFYARLRSRLAEVSNLPPEEDAKDTMFSESEIAEIYSYAGGDLNLATLEGWKRKVARLARLIDVSESGSDRTLSQRFRQAKAMLDFWHGLVSETQNARATALTGRVVGSVINLREDFDPNPGTPFSGYTDHVRMYPTHRLLIPAIMG